MEVSHDGLNRSIGAASWQEVRTLRMKSHGLTCNIFSRSKRGMYIAPQLFSCDSADNPG